MYNVDILPRLQVIWEKPGKSGIFGVMLELRLKQKKYKTSENRRSVEETHAIERESHIDLVLSLKYSLLLYADPHFWIKSSVLKELVTVYFVVVAISMFVTYEKFVTAANILHYRHG